MFNNCECCKNDIFSMAKFQDNNYKKLLLYCNEGKLKEAKELVEKKKIYVSLNNEVIFRSTCKNGNLKVAKWLLKKFPTINPFAENNDAFYHACKNGHLNVAQWLYNLNSSSLTSKINIDLNFINSLSNKEIKNWLNMIVQLDNS